MITFGYKFKNFFSEQARKPSGLFGRWVMSRIFDRGNAAINDFMKEQLLLQENDPVLEIGFGTARLICEMAKRVNTGLIEGIDLSDTMVAIAKKKNKKYIAEGKVISKIPIIVIPVLIKSVLKIQYVFGRIQIIASRKF
jgi:cyclopropane fatty-acyl-phospholipid synthase-like methyltransferase